MTVEKEYISPISKQKRKRELGWAAESYEYINKTEKEIALKKFIEYIPFDTEVIVDNNLQKGEIIEDVKGRPGEKEFYYNIIYKRKPGIIKYINVEWHDNIKQISETMSKLKKHVNIIAHGKNREKVIKESVKRVVRVGPGTELQEKISQDFIQIESGIIPMITNKKIGLDFNIYKKDRNNLPIEGVEFKLVKKLSKKGDIDTSFAELKGKSDANGLVQFQDAQGNLVKLQEGFYELTETKVPKGYKGVSVPWEIEIVEDSEGKMLAKVDGPTTTVSEFLQKNNVGFKNSNGEFVKNNLNSNDEIKYASKVIYFDTFNRTFKQRIYIDISGYRGNEPINVEIIPVIKREERDEINKESITEIKGVKTTYRTTYRIIDPESNLNIDEVLNSYDLSKTNVEMINTARWRPFGWGFDEDQINLIKTNKSGQKNVYFIDIEGNFDENIENIGQIDLNIKFSTERNFEQATKDFSGTIKYKKIGKEVNGFWKNEGSYQKGNEIIGKNILSKEGGRVSEGRLIQQTVSRINIKDLYSKGAPIFIPKEGMNIVNDEESYNITFTKLGKFRENMSNEELAESRLEGAIFKLQEQIIEDLFVDVPGSYVSSAFNGYLGFRGLRPGRYRLMEVKAPEGYKLIKDPILYMTIAHDKSEITDNTGEITKGRGIITLEYGNSDIIAYEPDSATSQDGKLVDFVTSATSKHMGKIVNKKPRRGKIIVEKIDDNGNLLDGAKFKLTRLGKSLDGSEKIQEFPIGTIGEINPNGIKQKGKYIFEDLPIGQYRLEEIKPSQGYIKTGEVWNFTIGGEGLDPYSYNVLKPTGKDLTGKIRLSPETKVSIFNPKTSTFRPCDKNTSVNNGPIYPHLGESLVFENKFYIPKYKDIDTGKERLSINPSDIKPGDYFTLTLHLGATLENVLDVKESDLDIIADGVGTIAKAKYDKQNKKITYIFTEYVKDYKFTESSNILFSNTLSAYINLKEKKETIYSTQIMIKDANFSEGYLSFNLAINYDINKMTFRDSYYNNNEENQINLTSKITKFNAKTNEFTQYIYINRDKRKSSLPTKFIYSPDINVKDLNMTIYKLPSSIEDLNDLMPESFGIDENNSNLILQDTKNFGNIGSGQLREYEFINGISENDLFIIKMTGKILTENASIYSPTSYLRVEDNGKILANAQKMDVLHFNKNTAEPKKEFSLKVVNPKNRIIFRKVDADGNSLEGASFKLERKNENLWEPYGNEKTVNNNGIVIFEKLKEGEYRLIETKAPTNYNKLEEPAFEFKVNDNGDIIRKVRVPVEGKNISNETKEIEQLVGSNIIDIINYKDIEFIKVDDITKEPLQGAEFEIYYKETEKEIYKKLEKSNGEIVRIVSDEKGVFKFNISKKGYYALKETKAPDNYTKILGYTKELKFEKGKIYILQRPINGNPVYVYYNGINKIEVVNRKTKYPGTGGMGTLLFTITGVSLIILSFIISRRKKVYFE